MDPLSVASGIVGLFSTARDCYLFYAQLKNANVDMRLRIDELDIEASALHSWGYYWGVHPPGSDSSPKLDEYLIQNPYKKHGVGKTLLRIGELMTSDERLLDKYGIKLTIKDGENKGRSPRISDHRIPFGDQIHSVEEMRENKKALNLRIRLLRKCKWTLSHKNKFMDLLETLRRYNADLYRFCPEGAWNDMNRFRVLSFLNSHENPDALNISSRKADQQVQEVEDPSIRGGLELLRDMMKIKGKAGFYNSKPISDRERVAILRYDMDMLEFGSYLAPSTLALLRENHSRSMVYVEFKPYTDEHGTKLQGRQDAILKLGRLMLDSDTHYRLNTMKCQGLFKDSSEGRIGFIFRLPGQLGSVPSGSLHTADWDRRRPRRLLRILTDNVHHQFDLGWRFNLAKRLVDNVIRLHACGWLHKNIRSDSIIFFPRDTETSGRPSVDYSKGFLMGYDYVRIDTSIMEEISSGGAAHRDARATTTDRAAIRVGSDNRPDIYHHPDKRKSPDRAYQYAYDIYSLGLLLLEIGLWKPLPLVVEGKEHYDPDRLLGFIEDKVEQQLVGCCGHIYAKVVKTFITMRSKSNLDSMKLQRDTCAKMAGELSRCVV